MLDMGTVGELLDYLATQPRDRKIVLQKDAEGNGYSPLAEGGEAMYSADSIWSGEVHPTPEDLAEYMAEPRSAWTEKGAAPDGAERVVLLGPVN